MKYKAILIKEWSAKITDFMVIGLLVSEIHNLCLGVLKLLVVRFNFSFAVLELDVGFVFCWGVAQ